MNRKLTVILLEDVASLGRAGDIVTVSEGYARNALFPEGQAALADEGTRLRVAETKQSQKAELDEQLRQLQVLAEKLEGTELIMSARQKDEGPEIFGSVKANQIAEEFNKAVHMNLKAKDIKLSSPITKIGSQDIVVMLSPDVETKIRVTIVPDEET